VVGKRAPPIDLPAVNVEAALPEKKGAKALRLSDLKGKNVVLFFYPKALTAGCTIESCGFRDRAADFKKRDTVLLGISTDPLAKQDEFAKKNQLNFPLLADADKKVAKAYGVLTDNGFAKRVTFVIDRQGVVRKVYDKVVARDHPAEVLKFVEQGLEK
jgi:peroxiredoxin Q/BCP